MPTVADGAARGLAAQLDDYDERRKLEAALGVMELTGNARSAVERYDDLLAKAHLARLSSNGLPDLADPSVTAAA